MISHLAENAATEIEPELAEKGEKEKLEEVKENVCVIKGQKLKCQLCFKEFSKSGFGYHLKQYHEKIKNEKCEICNRVFGCRSTLNNHMKSLHGTERNFSCKECSQAFKTLSSLYIHRKQVHDDKRFSCELCYKKFAFRKQLTEHLLIHSKEQTHFCKICRKGFRVKANLSKHLRVHEDVGQFNFTKEDLEEDLEENSSNIYLVRRENKATQSNLYICEICNHTTKRSNNLQRHLSTHTSDNPCSVCCLSFTTKHGLKHHIFRDHNQEEIEMSNGAPARIKCERCSDEFSSRFQLYFHEKEIHEASERFICSKCGQVFPEENLLNMHLKKHREFICSTCKRGLKSKKALIEHQNTHTGEKPFRCEDCGKSFGYSTNLLEHRKIHFNVKEHKCGYCDKAFSRSNMLKEHERVHTKDKPYSCSFCEANFTQSNSLKKHLRKFHKSCPKCGDYVGDDIDEMIHKCQTGK
ncbi:zinc finger protein 595-like [Phlebotomus papatasi]|uniref:zinc finger protein 595-like n=1 Tax=Phlebotomus papatasi TaxID=29031 RepID=UPI00248466D9|nr:zinc finger protein 595-like [Phlebotomus papatasi]